MAPGAAVARPWLLAGWGWLILALAGAAAVVHHRALGDAVVGGVRSLARPRSALAALGVLMVVYVAR